MAGKVTVPRDKLCSLALKKYRVFASQGAVMAKVYNHPITGLVYSVNEVGLVDVRDPKSDSYGVFDDNGVWFEGEIIDVDLQAAGWVGRTPEARALREANS